MRRTTAREAGLARLKDELKTKQARAIAERAKLHEVTISNWKRGVEPFNPKLDELERLAHGLDLTIAEIVGDAPTFEDRLKAMGPDEKLALARRLLAELPEQKR